MHRFAPVLLAVFVFGVANLISAPYPVGIFHDDGVYLILAKALASGDGYRYLHLPGAPLATHYPWQLRTGMPAATDRLVSFAGTFVPLPRTEAERAERGDPRPSLEKLYGSRDAYLARVDAAARAIVAERFMLPEDAAAARARLAATWDWIMR